MAMAAMVEEGPSPELAATKVTARGVNVFYGDKQALFNVDINVNVSAVWTASVGLLRVSALWGQV